MYTVEIRQIYINSNYDESFGERASFLRRTESAMAGDMERAGLATAMMFPPLDAITW